MRHAQQRVWLRLHRLHLPQRSAANMQRLLSDKCFSHSARSLNILKTAWSLNNRSRSLYGSGYPLGANAITVFKWSVVVEGFHFGAMASLCLRVRFAVLVPPGVPCVRSDVGQSIHCCIDVEFDRFLPWVQSCLSAAPFSWLVQPVRRRQVQVLSPPWPTGLHY